LKRDTERNVPERGLRIAAASATAIGDVAQGAVIDDFALKKIADEFVGEVAELVGAGVEVLRNDLAVLIGDLVANQFAYLIHICSSG
jgi:hypothetical protein